MSSFLGADPDQLRDLHQRFTTESHRAGELARTLQQQLGSLHWEGPDAEDFTQQARTALNRASQVTQQIESLGQALQRQAEAQDHASSASGSDGGSTGGSTGASGDDHGGSGQGASGGGGGGWGDEDAHKKSLWDKVLGLPGEGARKMSEVSSLIKTNATKSATAMFKELDNLHLPSGKTLASVTMLDKLSGKLGPLAIGTDLAMAAKDGRRGDAIGSTAQLVFNFTPPGRVLGTADAFAGEALSHAPSNWTYPGTDMKVSETSPLTAAFREFGNFEQDSPSAVAGAAAGDDISDSMGVKNQTARNIISTTTSVGNWAVTHADPVRGAIDEGKHLADKFHISAPW